MSFWKNTLHQVQKIYQGALPNRAVLALDIGTDVVKAIVFEKREDGKGHVVGVGRCKQQLSDTQGGVVTDIFGVMENCRQAIEQAEAMAGKRVKQVIIGIAGELVKGSTTTVTHKRDTPQEKISLKELQNIVKKIQWEAFAKVRKQLSWETGYQDMDVRLVNAAIVDVQIDGFRVTNPLGFQGKSMVLGIFNAFAPLVHVGALETVAVELGLELLSIAAEPYAVARSVEGHEVGEFSSLFIDIGGGTTDVALVQKGGLVGTKSFGLGGRAFTKRVAQDFFVPFERAEEMKISYSEGAVAEGDELNLGQALEKDCTTWMSGVELVLEEFASMSADPLPARILLCGGGVGLPEIRKVLREYRWTSKLTMLRKPDIVLMTPEQVHGVVDKTGQLVTQQDITVMGLAHLALQFSGKERILDAVVQKVVDMINT